MKVSELVEGMIVRPSVNKYTKRRMHFDVKRVDLQEEKDCLSKSATVVYCNAGKKSIEDDIAIYIGTEKSNSWIDGVKTHHYLLVKGETAIISGYEVRYLEPVER